VTLPSPGEILLLLTRLSGVNGVEQADTILSPDELTRAGRLLRQDIRQRFIAGRLFLRRTLARCLGLDPAQILLTTNQWGKPRLGGEQATGALCFNLSHTDDRAILALSPGAEVGVDIELVRGDLEFRPMARRFFSPREQEEFFGLDEGEQLAAFFRCWTRKEACLKGFGGGLAIPTDCFDVSLLPGHPPRLTGHSLDPAEPGRWSLADIPLPSGLCGAVAMRGDIRAVRFVH
jgi:4'-phosphopantetheinyl transferase